MARQGNEMQKRARGDNEGNELAVGTIVQVHVADVDRAKTDPTNATLVIVEVCRRDSETAPTYRLACSSGVIKTKYARSYVKPIPLMTPQLVGLEQALEGWQQMKEVGLRAAMKDVSAVGGQGMLRCSCKGACNRNTCTCFKNGRRCNSRCHAGSKACCNHD